jgi:hypothetical protein
VSRLTWTYLFRCTETTSVTFKKLDTIIKTIFPPYRRAVYPADTPLDHFILITYFSLMRDVDSGTKKVLFYLLNTEASSTSNSSHNWDLINPERMIIALSAFRLLLSDLEQNIQKPPFPADTDMTSTGISINCTADVFSGPIRAVKPEVTEKVEEIINKTLASLDQTFGRLLVLDEKNIIMRAASAQLTTVLNTSSNSGNSNNNNGNAITTTYSVPIFTNSATSDNSGPQIHHQYTSFSVSYTKDKQAYFDVIKTIIDGMPRIMPAGLKLSKLVDMLARYTVHTDPEIIRSASKALLRIASQIDSQTVAIGFSNFVCEIEDKFCDVIQSLASGPLCMTSSGGSSLTDNGGGVIKLYVDLLSIWVDQLDLEKPANSTETARESVDARIGQLLKLIITTEANGLLFLCNQSSSIRRSAIQIIKMAAKLADRLNVVLCNKEEEKEEEGEKTNQKKPWSRLSHLLENAGQDMIHFDKDATTLLGVKVTSDIRTRLLQHQRRGLDHVLIQIAESDQATDVLIWNICLPHVFRLCFQYFPQTTAECRNSICKRLLEIQPSILAWLETIKAGTTGTLSMAKSSSTNHKAASPETIEQWRIYLVFACATAVPLESNTSAHSNIWSHVSRKGSANTISSPRDLFRLISPFLTCEHRPIRESAIDGLGNINCNVYKSLMFELEGYIKVILDDGKQRNNQKPYQNKRSKKNDRLRISVMHVLELTAGCLSQEEYVKDKELMNVIMSYIKETKSFLVDTEVQIEWEYQRLRIYLCGLVEKLYESIIMLEDQATSFMSFETRLSLYKMFEEWCGYGASAKTAQQREATMMRDVLEQCKDPKERTSMTQLMEEERKALESASLSAMATLCVSEFYIFGYITIKKKLTIKSLIARSFICLPWAEEGSASHYTI